MAKRKRLNPIATLTDVPVTASGSAAMPRRVPIADVAGDASVQAALAELADEMSSARAEGRLIQALPLEAVEAGHLLRDRIPSEGEDMAALIESLRARGQQVPIEVSDMGAEAPDGLRYGLISGWRRLMALRRLHGETGEDRFASVLAVLRRPEGASEAYLAMVEENEIRVGLSYYERARVAARAAEAGVFADTGAAIRALFASASKAKRSKIQSFVRIYEALDEWLAYPAALPERLGLKLAKVLDAGQAKVIQDALAMAAAGSAEAEMAALGRAVSTAQEQVRGAGVPKAAGPATSEIAPGVRMQRGRRGLTLSGPGVDSGLEEALADWLRKRR